MKQAILTGLLIAVSFGSIEALAQADKHPCAQIIKACKSAGFVKNDHKDGKGLWVDCVNKIVNGQSVAGVNISNPEDVASCKAKREERKEKKDKK